jgi:hypothetical protein
VYWLPCARLAPDDDKSEGADDVFVGVTCLVCGLVHFVNHKNRQHGQRKRRVGRSLSELTDGAWDSGVAHHRTLAPSGRWVRR